MVVVCLSLVGGVLLEFPEFCGFLNDLPPTCVDDLTPSSQVPTMLLHVFSSIAKGSLLATDGLLALLPFVLDLVGVAPMPFVSLPFGESVSVPFGMQFSPSIWFDSIYRDQLLFNGNLFG